MSEQLEQEDAMDRKCRAPGIGSGLEDGVEPEIVLDHILSPAQEVFIYAEHDERIVRGLLPATLSDIETEQPQQFVAHRHDDREVDRTTRAPDADGRIERYG